MTEEEAFCKIVVRGYLSNILDNPNMKISSAELRMTAHGREMSKEGVDVPVNAICFVDVGTSSPLSMFVVVKSSVFSASDSPRISGEDLYALDSFVNRM